VAVATLADLAESAPEGARAATNRMIRSTLVSFALSSSLLFAQEQTTQASPQKGAPLVSIRAHHLPKLLEQLGATRLGKLLADEEGSYLMSQLTAFQRRAAERRRGVLQEAITCGVELEPWMTNNLFASPDLTRVYQHAFEEIAGVELLVHAPKADGQEFPRPDMSVVLRCGPRYEGQWTQAFEREAAMLRKAPWFQQDVNGKVGGYPAYVFEPVAREDDDSTPYRAKNVWMLHVPGTFVYATGAPPVDASYAPPGDDAPAEVRLTMDLKGYVEMFQNGRALPPDFVALGFDKLKSLSWSGRVVGDLLLDEFAVELTDADPTGFVGMLVRGDAPPPAQALPDGAVFQLRTSIAMDALGELLEGLPIGLPNDLIPMVQSTFDGGVSIGVCAPLPGGVIPRLYASLHLADAKKFGELVTNLLPRSGLETKQVTYEGVSCTILKIPDAPQGIQPAWCVLDGALHIAESGRSLRSLLKARADGVVAMDSGDAKLPEGPGERIETFEMCLDEAELYRCYHEIWLPLFELMNDSQTAFTRDDMPEPDVVAELLGKSRGAMFRDDNRFVLRHLGALGGPETAAIAMTWGPILTADMRDYTTEQLATQVTQHKARRLFEAFEAFEQREKRLPNDLAELIVAQKLDVRELSLPGATCEQVTLPDGREVPTAFRYFPQKMMVDSFNEAFDALLIEIAPRSYERVFLAKDGSLPSVYGEAAQQSIDDFGK